MNLTALKEVGLTDTETKVYISLLKEGSSLASNISRKSGVERAVTYHILEKLIRKGLTGYVIKENRKYFSAASPEILKCLLKEKEDSLNEIIPELEKLKRIKEEPLSVEVFRGREGFKTVQEDLIRWKMHCYTIGTTGKSQGIAGEEWYRHLQKRRVKRGIKRYFLVSDKNIKLLKYPLTYVRCLPQKIIHESKCSIIIYGEDRVLLFLPLEEFAGIRIINKEIHESYKDYFDMLWKLAKKE